MATMLETTIREEFKEIIGNQSYSTYSIAENAIANYTAWYNMPWEDDY